jgi:hypothetical protein
MGLEDCWRESVDRRDPLMGRGQTTRFWVAFDHEQRFDFAGLRGRLLASSYAPLDGQPNHQPMMEDLRRLFDRHQEDGAVRIGYEMEMFYGRLG